MTGLAELESLIEYADHHKDTMNGLDNKLKGKQVSFYVNTQLQETAQETSASLLCIYAWSKL